jgi:hypothetical protein
MTGELDMAMDHDYYDLVRFISPSSKHLVVDENLHPAQRQQQQQ